MVRINTQLKLAVTRKKYKSDMFNYDGIIALGKTFPSIKDNRMIKWFTTSDETLYCKTKIYASL
ncbi:hypothetical protein EG240_01890 [Paenimyroides tangerinum]|uniref:Uncharacterized protein n=1 Tax=Paenimyroides tangerinum TaxID=2488728 RepID=A0A3P3WC91_9FLAO|nr:hypothetical protein [Paenimyroides tangerinum]RRJ92791.1 hypothetical protein EG240_01890 [Paenimyroides tangerinum]